MTFIPRILASASNAPKQSHCSCIRQLPLSGNLTFEYSLEHLVKYSSTQVLSLHHSGYAVKEIHVLPSWLPVVV